MIHLPEFLVEIINKSKVLALPYMKRKREKRVVSPITVEGAKRLAAAIIESASNDYRDAGFKIKLIKYQLRHKIVTRNKDHFEEIKKYEALMNLNRKFITTSPIVILMNLDPSWIMETLDKQIEEYDPNSNIKLKRSFGYVR